MIGMTGATEQQDQQEQRALPAKLAPKGTLASTVLPVSLEHPASAVILDCQGRKETQARWGPKDLWAPWAFPATSANPAQRAPKAILLTQGRQDPLAALATQAAPEGPDGPDGREIQAGSAPRVLQAALAPLATQDGLALLAREETPAPLGPSVCRAQTDRWAVRGPLAKKATKATLA